MFTVCILIVLIIAYFTIVLQILAYASCNYKLMKVKLDKGGG